MTKKKLNLIILMQSYQYFLVSEDMFNNNERNYLNELWRYFLTIDKDILKELGYSHNNKSFNDILNFEVTDELMNSELK